MLVDGWWYLGGLDRRRGRREGMFMREIGKASLSWVLCKNKITFRRENGFILLSTKDTRVQVQSDY